MTEPWLTDAVIILLLLICSAFFSGSETALTAVSRARLFTLIRDGSKRAMLVMKLRDKKESLIGAILLGNNLVNIAAASLATMLSIRLWGEEYGPLYATLGLTLLVLVFSEILPKTVAIHHSERVSLLVSPLLGLIIRILSPITHLIQTFIAALLRIFGIKLEGESLISGADVIRGTIELHHEEGEVEKQDRDMLGSILDLDEREVGEVMVHRKSVETIDIGLDPDADSP